MKRSVQAVTLNVWGLPDLPFKSLSPHRSQRIDAICAELCAQAADPDGWDVVLIQEAWIRRDRRALKSSGYPFHVDLDERRKMLDSGLLILSRYPIDPRSVARLRYPRGGSLRKAFIDGEFFASKSGLIARVLHPRQEIWVANTHLIAQYPGARDAYFERRKFQLTRFLSWVLEVSAGDPLILGGDLNFGPGSVEWELLMQTLPGFSEAPNACEIFTLDRDCPSQAARFQITGGHKIDHLFASPHFEATHGRLAFHTPFELEGKPAGHAIRVSDHFGLETHFEIRA